MLKVMAEHLSQQTAEEAARNRDMTDTMQPLPVVVEAAELIINQTFKALARIGGLDTQVQSYNDGDPGSWVNIYEFVLTH
jgi:hypothetical protein